MRKARGKSGLTLIELLLVTVLLVFFSFTIFHLVRSSLALKTKLDRRTEYLQEQRTVLTLLSRDFRSAFFVTAEDFVWSPPKNDPNAAPGLAQRLRQDPQNQRPNPVTLFQGEKSQLFFSCQSHQRLSANAPENHQHLVLYQLKNKELIRGESLRVVHEEDRENAENYRNFVLLENVSKLEFSYWNEKSERWEDSWDAESSEKRDKVPGAIKVLIEYTPKVIEGEEDKEIKPRIFETSIRLQEAELRNVNWKKIEALKRKAEEKNNP